MVVTGKILGSTRRNFKKYSLLSAAAMLAAVTQFGAQLASAATVNYTWTGTAADNSWHLLASSDWSGGTGLWVNNATIPSADSATFNLAIPATISVTSAITVGTINFSTTGWALTDGGGSLSVGGAAGTLTVNTGTVGTNSDTISANIINTSTFATALTKSGLGTLILSGTNDTYTGATTVSDGTLNLPVAINIASSAVTVSNVNNDGTTLSLFTSNLSSVTRTGAVTLDAANLTLTATPSIGSTVDAMGALTLKLTGSTGATSNITITPDGVGGDTSTLNFAGAISRNAGALLTFGTNTGTTGIVKFGTAPAAGNGTPTSTILAYATEGQSFVTYDANGIRPLVDATETTNGGAMTAGQNNLLNSAGGSPTGTYTSGALSVSSLIMRNDGITPVTLNLSGNLTNTSGGVMSTGTVTGNNISGGTLVFSTQEAIFQSFADLSVSSAITGSGGLTKAGAGTLQLGGSLSGLTGRLTVNAGTLALNGSSITTSGLNMNTGTTISNAGATSGTATLTYSNGGGGNGTAAALLDGGTGGKLALDLTGGQLVLTDTSTSNTYSGGTSILQSVVHANGNVFLVINGDGASGAVPSSPTTNINLSGDGALDANASMTLNANRGITLGLGFHSGVTSSTTQFYGGILTANNGGFTVTYAGTISDNGGPGTITYGINGSSTNQNVVFVISGASTYSGGTAIAQGTLELGVNDGASGSSTSVLGAVPSSYNVNGNGNIQFASTGGTYEGAYLSPSANAPSVVTINSTRGIQMTTTGGRMGFNVLAGHTLVYNGVISGGTTTDILQFGGAGNTNLGGNSAFTIQQIQVGSNRGVVAPGGGTTTFSGNLTITNLTGTQAAPTVNVMLAPGGNNAGTLVLSGSNTFSTFPTFNVSNGTIYNAVLAITSDAALGTLAIDIPSSPANQIFLGNATGTTSGTLLLNGSFTLNPNRGIGIGGTAAGTAATTTGVIDVTGGNTAVYGGVIAGLITSATTAQAQILAKTDAGTLVLSGASTFGTGTDVTGAVGIDGGVLKIDASTGSLVSTDTMAFNGGTFAYDATNATSGAKSQNLGAMTLVSGESTVKTTLGGGGATSVTVTYASQGLRTAGSVINFVTTDGANGSTNSIVLTGVTAGFISTADFFDGADYAYESTTGGFLRAPVYGTDTNFINDPTGATLITSASNNTLVTASIASQGTVTQNTLKFATSSEVDLALASNAILTDRGILRTGGGATVISGSGTANLTSGGIEFIVRTDTSSDLLTINVPVSAVGLTKSGAGTLVLGATNTYTTATIIDAGTVSFSADNNLGATSAGIVINGGTLSLSTGSVTLTTGRGIKVGPNVGPGNGTIDVSGTALTYNGVIANNGANGGVGNLIKTGVGSLVLGGVSTYTGSTTVNGGTLSVSSAGNINKTSGTTLNGGTFNYNSATAYTQSLAFGTGGTVSGTGTISASGGVTAGTSAIVAPGNGVASPGSQSFTTGLTFNTGSTYQWNNNEGNTAGVVGTNFSSIVNGGSTIAINDGTLALTFNATTDFISGLWSSAHTWDIISGGGVTGAFANITLSGSSLSLNNAANTLSQGTFSDALTGGDLVLTWTPTIVAGGVPAGSGTWHNGTSDGKWTTNTGSGNNWLTGIPNAVDQVATFDDTAVGGPGTVDLNGDKTVGGLNLNTALVGYTLGLPSTTNTLTLQNSSGTASINVGNNSGAGAAHTIDALVNLASNTNVSLATGTSLNMVGAVSGTGSLNLSGTGVLKLSAAAGNTYTGTNISGGTLLVANTSGSATGSSNVVMTGGTLGGSGTISGMVNASTGTVFPSATLSTTSTTTLTMGGLTTGAGTTLRFNLVTPGNSLNHTTSSSDRIAVTGSTLNLSGGTVNLTNHTTGAASLGFYKVIAFSGTISGTGLSSLSLPAVANNVSYVFDTTHDAGFIDIHRGFLGDVDDSGFVDINDLSILASNWQQAGGWAQGNFLGDPTVDINDLSVLAANWQTGVASFGDAADSLGDTSESFQQAVSSIVFGGAGSVPEPTSLALLGMGAAGLLIRRRRR